MRQLGYPLPPRSRVHIAKSGSCYVYLEGILPHPLSSRRIRTLRFEEPRFGWQVWRWSTWTSGLPLNNCLRITAHMPRQDPLILCIGRWHHPVGIQFIAQLQHGVSYLGWRRISGASGSIPCLNLVPLSGTWLVNPGLLPRSRQLSSVLNNSSLTGERTVKIVVYFFIR